MFGDQLRDLSAWMAAAGIDTLELTGPSVRLRLVGDGGDQATKQQVDAPEPASVVTAPVAGHFLHHHPLHTTALAPAGTQVRAGHIVGLLRIDMLVVPVLAPRDGRIGATLVPHDTLVGFGTGLIELQPIEREAQ
ncbi:hypothetical protein [Bradyrhizobium prioriisuperbiae]|uniref:hypothetical protein n=1 Tax=Bradyrhizobium prioriisuperbiae TaxID=2854389 RepID=UPI0028EBCA7B|nr:hypothetical protein [Bradyrhizobium prioritasuperba]